MIVSVDADELAAAVMAEAQRHPARSPERRAASHLWAALITSPSIAAARRAIATFGDETTQSDAAELLGRLAAELSTAAANPPSREVTACPQSLT